MDNGNGPGCFQLLSAVLVATPLISVVVFVRRMLQPLCLNLLQACTEGAASKGLWDGWPSLGCHACIHATVGLKGIQEEKAVLWPSADMLPSWPDLFPLSPGCL